MINFTNTTLDQIIIHQVGNKTEEADFKLSKAPVHLDNGVKALLLKYFLNPFKNSEYYHLHHESDLGLNELFAYCSTIFDNPECFFIESIKIAKHLFEVSSHPKIKSGEFYVTYLSDITVDDEMGLTGIGLFKSENKDTYLKVYPKGDNYEVNYDDGININRLDKGCIIFNTEKENGFKVCVVDATNKTGEEAQYWKDQFIRVKPREDSYYHTQNYLKLCNSFFSENIKESFEFSRADEIDIMNKSVDFFKKNEVFDLNKYTEEIIEQPDIIDAFNNYKQQYQEDNEVKIFDEFNISSVAVKRTSKDFKSVLKLDKNFHVYIHGNRDFIVKGFDEEKGLNFYQLFFKEES